MKTTTLSLRWDCVAHLLNMRGFAKNGEIDEKALAEAMHVNRSTVYRVFRRQTRPSQGFIASLSHVLNVEPGAILRVDSIDAEAA